PQRFRLGALGFTRKKRGFNPTYTASMNAAIEPTRYGVSRMQCVGWGERLYREPQRDGRTMLGFARKQREFNPTYTASMNAAIEPGRYGVFRM
ncbi:MAG: hypothetical protein ACREPY_12835, partial [Rhodanobacteraceae bacterium]